MTDTTSQRRRVAIVTGSDSGIGRASAVALAQDGFDIGITWNTDQTGAEETANEVEKWGRRAAVQHLDLSQLPDAAGVIDTLAEELDGLDVLVNNAGTGLSTLSTEVTYEQWRDVLAVDLDGPFLCAQARRAG